MKKARDKAVSIYVRISGEDLVQVDKAAADIPVTRSKMVAIIVREWLRSRTNKRGK